MLVKDIVDIMEELAPACLAENWDNVGLLVGDMNAGVSKILFALDAIDPVIDEAVSKGADMIITHHPLIFKGVGRVNTSDALGRRIIKLIKNDISLYSAHTNFDIAEGGTNSVLAKLAGLEDIQGLIPVGEAFLGKTGKLKTPVTLGEFAKKLSEAIKVPSLKITGDINRVVERVGLCTGSGADRDFMLAAKQKGCDVYVTGDVSYHNAQFASDIDLCLIDATHYYTEAAAMPYLCEYIKKKSGIECIATEVNGESFTHINGWGK